MSQHLQNLPESSRRQISVFRVKLKTAATFVDTRHRCQTHDSGIKGTRAPLARRQNTRQTRYNPPRGLLTPPVQMKCNGADSIRAPPPREKHRIESRQIPQSLPSIQCCSVAWTGDGTMAANSLGWLRGRREALVKALKAHLSACGARLNDTQSAGRRPWRSSQTCCSCTGGET